MQTKTLSTLVAFFRTDAEARAAADDLKANGIDAGDIFITAANTTGTNEIAARDYRHHEGGIKGWFHSLFGEDQDETNEAATEYENAVNSGNVMLTVETTEQNVDTATDILNRHSPIDVRRETGASDVLTGTQTPQADTRRDTAAREAIPVVREELKIGKRAILRGGVRVYSRVVEEPVQETIGLREEKVRVDRTPVNREVTDADLRSGKEQVFEVKEYAEEPVVSKTARVVEEVRVRKEAAERNETIRDTVRHTEVNVENLGGNAATTDTQSLPGTGVGDYSADFRRDFDQRYANTGETFDTYSPAYTYGYEMANDPRYRGRRWEDVEEDLRADYGRRYPSSTWQRFKDSVRYGWDRLTNKV